VQDRGPIDLIYDLSSTLHNLDYIINPLE
jgi:hypothetical protein